jgi:hypothetical protein
MVLGTPKAGLSGIGRVLHPGGRAVVWDLRPGLVPFTAMYPTRSSWRTTALFASSVRRRGAGPGG